MSKLKCKCGKLAVWFCLDKKSAYCDDCVPRGCSWCNERPFLYDYDNKRFENFPKGQEGIDWKIVNENCWEPLNKGRALPCEQFWYDKEGWEDE